MPNPYDTIATLRDQVRTLQDLLQDDKYTATASEASALATVRMLREKLRTLCDAAEVTLTVLTPVTVRDLKAAVAAAREALQ